MTNPVHGDNEPLGAALAKSAWKAGLSDLVANAGDLGIDQLLDPGVLKDLPIIEWFAKVRSVTRTLRDAILLKKILRFLEGAASATEKRREAFRQRMEKESDETIRIGELILLHIDRHEHYDKSFYAGLVFAAFVESRIDRETFDRLMTAIDRLDAGELKRLPELYSSLADLPEDVGQVLQLAGLVRVYFTVHDLKVASGPQPAGSGRFNYSRNELGQTLASILERHTA